MLLCVSALFMFCELIEKMQVNNEFNRYLCKIHIMFCMKIANNALACHILVLL